MPSFYFKTTLIIIMCMMIAQPIFSQKAPTQIDGTVIDAFTRTAIQGEVKVALLNTDSTVIQTVKCEDRIDQGNGQQRKYFTMDVPEQKTVHFILKYTSIGYQNVYKPIKVVWRKRKANVKLWNTSMRRLSITEEQQMEEVVVTATKIKFYMKNDTLIFNANAFQLQNGSLLDGLITQLPGAELKPDGRIFVKGRHVESLLLNGRDFFKGDNTVLLDNLPAYMVQQVQVYEEASEMSKLVGKKVDDGQYVMDIKLKKQYSIGWLTNTEWGYGTEKRYLGRLFTMRYTPQSRVSIFGNINNVNDRRKPDGSGGWGSFDPTGGLTATKRGGMDYNIYDKRERFELSGNADVSYTDHDNIWGGTATNFIPGGDTYESRQSKSSNSNLSVSTEHFFKYKGHNGKSFSITPTFNYYKKDYTSAYMNGTFSVQPIADYTAVLDSLFSPQWTTTMRNLIKRNGEWAKGNGHGSSGNVSFWTYFKRPYSTDGISVEGDVSYNSSRSNDLNHFTYNWYENNVIQNDYRDRYNTTPTDNFGYYLSAKYFWHWGKEIMLTPRYMLNYHHASGDRLRYSIATDVDEHDLNWLPSQFEQVMASMDTNNSYSDRLNRYSHELNLDWQWTHMGMTEQGRRNSGWYVQIKPAIVIERNNYQFTVLQKQHINKTYVLPKLNVNIRRNTPRLQHTLNATLSLTTASPRMFYLVDRTFTNDPLNVSLGNPDLEKRTDFNATFRYQSDKWLQNKGRQFYGDAGINASHHAMATSFTYDSSTGVKTNRPVNVDGNWNSWVSLGFNTPIDKKRKLTFSTDTRVDYNHLVDYSSNGQVAVPVRVTTNACYVNENIKFDYRYNKVNIGISGNMGYNHATADRDDFNNVNLWSIRYGGHAIIDLPWKIQLSTDLTMFSRRGYESREMNRNDLVWNARLSKSVWSNRLTFMVDAWDILDNLSDVNAGVNGQGRWEYYYNVIPRYALVRVLYRFDHQPKKRQ